METAPTVAPERRRPVTIHDVAKAAGVGKTTVSFVLNDKGNISEATREAVFRAIKELGFQANPHATRLANGHCAKTVGIYSLNLDLNTGSNKVRHIQRALHDLGYSAPLYAYTDSGGNEGENQQLPLIRTLCLQRPRAIIFNTTNVRDEVYEELRRYQSEGGLVVSYDNYVDLDCDRVVFDREHNTYLAGRHLVEFGHRKIGYFTGGPVKPSGDRIDGLRKAMAEENIELRDEWLFHGGEHLEYEEQGVLCATQFLNLKDRPTAMCIINDYTAVAFIAEVIRGGLRVPEDVSVVGHDDRPIGRYSSLPVTSVTHPTDVIAQEVVNLLTSRLKAPPKTPTRQIVVRGELKVRESTGPLHGHTP